MFQERHRIDVDCRRTDRTQPLFSTAQPSDCLDLDDEKERQRRYSTISPNISDIGAQAPSNDHIERLAGILLTYNFYEKDLGAHFHLYHVGIRNDVWCFGCADKETKVMSRVCRICAPLCTSSWVLTKSSHSGVLWR
jgi:hypothetical protein